MLIQGASLHTSIFSALVKYQFDNFRPRTIQDVAKPLPPRGIETRHVAELGVDVGVDDPGERGIRTLERGLIRLLNLASPRTDPTSRYTSLEETEAELRKAFGDRLEYNVQWLDPSGDAALVRLATQGLAGHMLERDGDEGYRVDLAFLEGYRVRKGFQPYGANLKLDRDLKPRAITWEGEDHTPGSPRWHESKLVFRAAVATAATLRDHAVHCHFLTSNAGVVAARKHLSNDHPIRLLLRPFQYRTPTINAGALLTLIPENAIFHRLFAFEWDALHRLYGDAVSDYRMERFPDSLERRGVTPLLGKGVYPYGDDALAYWNLVHAFVADYVTSVGVGGAPEEDPELLAFHQELVRCVLGPANRVLPMRTRAELIDLCTYLIFVATAYHEQVGGATGDYLSRPDFVVPALRAGSDFAAMLPTKNTMIQSYMLSILTNFKMPRIDADFSSLVPESGAPAVRRWLTSLGKYGAEIAMRNAARAQPVVTFDPRFMELSVSI